MPFFFVCYLHVSGFRCLMVLRWNESNLLCDSQTILPAITLIHSGQWILMTMKPGSCEDILQALVLVTLVRLSRACSLVLFTSKKTLFFGWYAASKSLFIGLCWTMQSFFIFMLVKCFSVKCLLNNTSLCLLSSKHLEKKVALFVDSKLPGRCWLISRLTFFYESTQQCMSHYMSTILLWNTW